MKAGDLLLDDFEKHLETKLHHVEFTTAWEDSEAEFNFIRAFIKARNASGLTQQQLSAKTGIDQAILSRIENGKANPSILTLQKLAKGLGKKLIIDFK
jgi:ribosome-binding protein aMBF1 (putative translation factor)